MRRAARSRLLALADRLTPSIKGVICDGRRVLLSQRSDGSWELPGDRRRSSENNRSCLRRWFQEHLREELTVGGPMGMGYVELPNGDSASVIVYGCWLPQRVSTPDPHSSLRLFELPLPSALLIAETYHDYVERWTQDIANGQLPDRPPKVR